VKVKLKRIRNGTKRAERPNGAEQRGKRRFEICFCPPGGDGGGIKILIELGEKNAMSWAVGILNLAPG
jgi:hypothetical protein